MRRYLVVAHKTLGGAHLLDHLHRLREEDPYCRFHLIVPATPPSGGLSWTEGEARAIAIERLDTISSDMAAMGMGVTGEVGDADPVYAVGVAMRREGPDAFTGVILSTLPKGISRWWNAPKRMLKRYPDMAVTHLVAEDAMAS